MTPRRDGPLRAAVAAPALEAVRARAPEGVEIAPLGDELDLTTLDFLVPAHSDHATRAALPELERLAVVQVLSAGTDWIEPYLPPQATLCSARGARDGPVAEWVLAALLGASSGLLEGARERRWSSRHLTDLAAWTVLIVGHGSIGHRVEALLHAVGARTIGVASHARDGVQGVSELPDLLARADAVVVLTPLSDATRGLIGGAELAAMRDGTLVVNAGRGPVIDTEALLAELRTGRLRAVLDVTDPEPLPDGHPLWEAPGLLAVTPHVAGDSRLGHTRAAELAGDQLARWAAGEELLNVVRRGPPPERR